MRKDSVTYRAFQKYHSCNPKYFPLRFLQILFQNISPYFNLWMSAEIVTALYEGRSKRELMLLVLVTLFGNLAVRIMEAVLTRVEETESEILKNKEAEAFNRKVLSLDYEKLENPDIRNLRRKIEENAWVNGYGIRNMKNTIEELMRCVIHVGLCLILFVEMLRMITKSAFLWQNLVLLLVMIGAMTLEIIFLQKSTKQIGKYFAWYGNEALKGNRIAAGWDSSPLDNRIYKQQIILDREMQKMEKFLLEVTGKFAKKKLQWEAPGMLFSQLTKICSYLLVGLYCVQGVFPVGSVIKYIGYLEKLTNHICTLFRIKGDMKANEPFLATYLEFFDIKNDMYQGSLAVEKRSDKKFDIEFKNVSFRYAGSETYALQHINLRLKVGERLAVVGMNGSGKTTFIKLLCRLYDPTEGEIIMNDFNVRKYDYRQYLDLFSVVFQDLSLLAVPLGNNVAASGNWNTEKAEYYLREVGFGERYDEMPRKLETPLYKNFDEDGVNISGGEAQKIALARALYRDAPFIILDEPTAALDPIAEAEIYTNFDRIVGDKTAIYISHRLSSCRFCDKIAVFDQGKIVQIGTHEELLADEKGKYHELWYAQAQYYTEEQPCAAGIM